jgi:hypothetical protein
MIWKNIIKRFILSLTPIIIIPAFLVFLILWTFGLSLASFLLIFTLAQIYLIWFHVEVALRQTKLTELSYEPVFIAYVKEVIGGRMHQREHLLSVTISELRTLAIILHTI